MTGQRAFLFGVWVQADLAQIDPIVIESGETAEQATRRGIARHGDDGDYQYVATIGVDESGTVLCRAEDLIRNSAPGTQSSARSGQGPRPGRYMVVGYYEGSDEAVTDSGPAASQEKAVLATKTVLRQRMRADDYIYLGTIYVNKVAIVTFTVENFERDRA